MSSSGSEPQFVYIPAERKYGLIIGPVGAYYTMVKYTVGGIDYEELLENDEYIPLEEYFLNYEPE